MNIPTPLHADARWTPPTREDRQRLLELIRRLSLKRGRFVLSSGAVSDYYLDLRLTTTHPEGAALAARFLLAEVRRLGADRLGGPTLGADPLVGAAMVLAPRDAGLGGFMVRSQAKDHGTGRQIEGHLEAGNRAVVFDDVVTAGGSIVRAIEAVRAMGATVAGTWCLVDRQQGGSEKLAELGAPLVPLFRVDEVLRDPDADGSSDGAGPRAEPLAREDSAEKAVRTAGVADGGRPWRPTTPVIAADAIVELEPDRVVLVRRRNPPHGWAIPGGFVEVGESVECAARRELQEETGLVLERIRQMHTYSEPGRDPRFPTVTVMFAATASGSLRAGDDAADARLFPLDDLPADLCFDHRSILEEYRSGRHGVGAGWAQSG